MLIVIWINKMVVKSFYTGLLKTGEIEIIGTRHLPPPIFPPYQGGMAKFILHSGKGGRFSATHE